jgi:hypothetical protein
MPSFERLPGESTSAWRVRLRGLDPSGLTAGQLNDLTACRVEADLAARRERRRAGRPAADGANGKAEESPAPSDALERCKEAVRALATGERSRLIWWLHLGMKD